MNPDLCTSLVDLLMQRSLDSPDDVAYVFLTEGEIEQQTSVTYAELDEQARAIGADLAQRLAQGERALLLYPPGLEFIAGFFGCLYAGVVAVPACPPMPGRPIDQTLAVANSATPGAVLTSSLLHPLLSRYMSQVPQKSSIEVIDTQSSDLTQAETWTVPDIGSDTLALLQYTSGSTSSPKGVMIKHSNLLANTRAVLDALNVAGQPCSSVSWLPQYHDMGLVGPIVLCMYNKGGSYLMSALDFLQKPVRWLRAISYFEADLGVAPNFAFELCARKITAEQREGLDLSCWNSAINAAEPILHSTLVKFAKTFAPCGFNIEQFFCCYGLAEATAFVSGGGPRGMRERTCRVDPRALEESKVVYAEGGRALVSSGLIDAHEQGTTKVVDPLTCESCEESQIGEIWIAGPSVAEGYWNSPEPSTDGLRAFTSDKEGPFCRTGDLGFVKGRALYVTGRLKDMIILNGRNHYPQDIERTVEQSHGALRPGCVAAFSVEAHHMEQLVVVQEVKPDVDPTQMAEIVDAMKQAVFEKHGLHLFRAVLVGRGGVAKTSSGKVRRRECRKRFTQEQLELLTDYQ